MQPRLIDRLPRWGASGDTAEDICQEVALRGVLRLARGDAFDSPTGVLQWSLRVARHLAIDEWRMRERHLDPSPVPDRELPDDLGNTVEWRLALDETFQAFAHLTPTERAALIAALHPARPISDKRARDREGLRRMRARDRLRRFVRGLPVAGPLQRLRWWLAESGAPVVTGMAAATILAVSAVLTALVPHEGRREGPTDGVTRVVTERTVQTSVVRPMTIERPSTTVVPRKAGAPVPPPPAPPSASPSDGTGGVAVPAPLGGELRTYTRPNAPDKPMVCAETWLTPRLCIDKPRLPRP